jgi:predicted ABC-type ATPase
VADGGHAIPEDVIERRYERSLRNLHKLYLPVCDRWIVVENSLSELRLIAQGRLLDCVIINAELWNWLEHYAQ